MSNRLGVYSIAVAASMFVLLLRYSLIPWLCTDTPLLIVVIAPIFASLYGTRPALLATALRLVGSIYFLMKPIYSFDVYGLANILRLILFGLIGISIGLIGGYRLKNKKALETSMQRQQIAVDAADLGLFEWDLREDTTIWENDRMYELFGHTRADGSINLRQFLDHYAYKEGLREFEKSLQQALRSGEKYNSTCRIIRKSDQQLRLTEFGGRFEYDSDKSPTKMIGVARDIT
jgi:PAS domain-containing protein